MAPNPTPIVPDITVSDANANSTVPSNVTPITPVSNDKKAFEGNLGRVSHTFSPEILRKAYRRLQMSRKKGAGYIVTRYTRKGKPVY